MYFSICVIVKGREKQSVALLSWYLEFA